MSLSNSYIVVVACFLILSPHFFKVHQDNIDLSIIVDGAKPNKGQVVLSVFDSKKSFLKDPILTQTTGVDELGESHFLIEDLKKGNYAISVFYDEDSNGELKTGFMGIPKELVGFSNNVKGTFGPPSFKKTVFNLMKSLEIHIDLGKAKD